MIIDQIAEALNIVRPVYRRALTEWARQAPKDTSREELEAWLRGRLLESDWFASELGIAAITFASPSFADVAAFPEWSSKKPRAILRDHALSAMVRDVILVLEARPQPPVPTRSRSRLDF